MRISLLLSLFVLSSCYSPKTDVEEDKYPEIPGFPNFSDKTVIVEKVLDLPLSQKDNCTFMIKDSYLLVYNFPLTDSYQNDTNRLFIINQGKLVIFEKWKTNPAINNLAFTDDAGNLYANNRKYLAPDFRYKQILPFFDLNDIPKKYESLFHKGESEKDSALMMKITDEQMVYQKNILEKGNHILMVTDDMNPEILDRSVYSYNYLFNPGKKNSYFVSHNLLQELATKDSAAEKDPLYAKLSPKIKLAHHENIFYPEIQKEYIDSVSFKIKDKIVSGNQWFSTGNHFVGSFGYTPVYLYYYDVKVGNKTVFTKEDHTQIVVSNPIKTKTGKYFLVSNIKEGKFQIYYLKN
ncbi:hypothetical protein [Chryseobacterium vrystaatense]|uniref:Uncharacterized protein n=1 Tax=Chryseobacterium vrystaatense TaxID=307480 RepID=A0A1M5PBU3_9FLAO|nr:hypothetical protein [Chryseobacterium vrystaatense]SHG99314.1 hypothetical protein SAMN02787073_0042 [Chryseobacterium vrystaatense]